MGAVRRSCQADQRGSDPEEYPGEQNEGRGGGGEASLPGLWHPRPSVSCREIVLSRAFCVTQLVVDIPRYYGLVLLDGNSRCPYFCAELSKNVRKGPNYQLSRLTVRREEIEKA